MYRSLSTLAIVFAIIISTLPITASTPASKITFHPFDLATLQTQAKEQGKLIYVDVWATWCGPCKWMNKNVYTDGEVATLYNESFICTKMNADSLKELAKNYGVAALPTHLFLDPDGKIVHKRQGGMGIEEFLALGREALEPETRLANLRQKYQAGERSRDFLLSYADALFNAGMEDERKVVADELFSGKSMDEILNKHWETFRRHAAYKMKSFDSFVANRELAEARMGKEVIDTFISDVSNNAVYAIIDSDAPDTTLFNEIISKALGTGTWDFNPLIPLNHRLLLYSKTENWPALFALAPLAFKDIEMASPMMLNNVAFAYYEHNDDSRALNHALTWAKAAVEKQRIFYILDTYASLLYKTGQYEEALKIEEEAMAQAKEAGVDVKVFEELIAKIKEKM